MIDHDDHRVASVVVPAWDSGERVVPALEALLAQDFEEEFEVIVVESGETGCGDVVRNSFPGVRFVRSRARLNVGEARNRGVTAARGRWIAFCSDDCVTNPDWLSLRVAKHREGFALVGGSVVNGSPRHPVAIADYFVEHTALMPSVVSRQRVPHVVSYDRELFAQMGQFPEDVPTGEDSVFNRRCVDLGATLGYEPRACFAHHGPTGLRAFLRHHQRHGRGYARCVELYDHKSVGEYPAVLLLVYPFRRWACGLGRVALGSPAELPVYLALTPLVVSGHMALAWSAWKERAALLQAGVGRRSRSASIPHREPAAASSGDSGQRSGRSSPS